jgi:outer membrane protein assembly factor BamB/orotate phosphoribosyltransferase
MFNRWNRALVGTTDSLSVLRGNLVLFLRKHSVIRAEQEIIVSGTGTPLKWLLDTRIALLNPEMSLAVSALFWDYLEPLHPFQMCCLELTGVPLMMGVQGYAMRCGYSVNGFVIRKEPKPTGRQRQIEGSISDLPIIFLDDILNSGESIERALVIVSRAKKRIARVVALVDFGKSTIGERLIREGIHLKSLIKLEELGVSKQPLAARQDIPRQMFREIWKFATNDHNSFDVVPKSTPALDSERVYFGTDSGRFYALNRETGKTDWTFQTGTAGAKGIRSSPLLAEDIVCFGAYDGVLYALEKGTGRSRWQFIQADWIGSSPCCAHELSSIYVGLEHALPRNRGSLVALDLQSGERKWEFQIEGLVHGSPIYIPDLGSVVIGSNNGAIYSLDALTGRMQWSFTTEGAIKSRPSYDPKRRLVIAGSFDKAIYAWSADTGAVAWKVCTGGVIYSEPLIVSDSVYLCSTDKYLYALQVQDGAEISRFYAGAKLFSSPIASGGRIYFASTGGFVYEFNPQSQSVSGTHFIGDRMTNNILCDGKNNRFYISTVEGHLIACERI